MPLLVDPPADDDQMSRHRFYAALAAALDNNTKAMTNIADKLHDIGTKHQAVSQEFNELKTTIRTTIRLAGVMTVLLGSVSGMILKQAWEVTDRVSRLERQQEIFQFTFKPHEDLPSQVYTLKSRVDRVEDKQREYHPPRPAM